jgi:hypothetical protein
MMKWKEQLDGDGDMPVKKFLAGAMQQIISAAIILAVAGFAYVALTGGLDRMNDTSTTVVGLGIILVWLLIIIGRSARLAITATHKKPIEKSNIVALAVAILGAVMFSSSHGVILGTNIQFLNIWIAIIGAVVVAIQWVDDYFKHQRLKEFGK